MGRARVPGLTADEQVKRACAKAKSDRVDHFTDSDYLNFNILTQKLGRRVQRVPVDPCL